MTTPPPLLIEHRARSSALEPERTWKLTGDTLHACNRGGPDLTIPLANIREVRLTYEPTRFQTNRYRCHLTHTSGQRTVLQNEHFAGIASFEDRTASYLELLHALIPRTAAANPSCVFKTGTSPMNWWLQAAFLTLCFALLALALVFLYTAIGWLVVVKLVILAFLIPVAVRWFRRNRPGTFTPDAIPTGMLPQIPGSR